jgi:hypothetical protein
MPYATPITKPVDKPLAEGFVLVYTEPTKPTWDPMFLTLLDAGVVALFFSDDNQVFGKGVGFDMDSYYLTGTYRIIPEADGDASLQKIVITGEADSFIEGDGEQEHVSLTESYLSIQDQNGKTLMSTDFTLFKRFDKSTVIKKNLTAEEMAKAKASFVRQ